MSLISYLTIFPHLRSGVRRNIKALQLSVAGYGPICGYEYNNVLYVGCSMVDRATQMMLILRRIYAIRTHLINGDSCPPSCLFSFPSLLIPLFSPLLFSPLLTLGCMETWMTSQCGSAAREGKSLGYSGLTRRRAGYADFSRSLHQH